MANETVLAVNNSINGSIPQSINQTINQTVNESINQSFNETVNNTVANTVNQTLSGIANGTSSTFLQQVLSVFIPTLAQRFWDIVTAPVKLPGMLWIVVPLVIALLLMEFYFSRYTKEELGWNTAVGNSLVLIFVSIDLLRHIFGDTNFLAMDVTQLFVVEKTIIALVIAAFAFLLLFTEFFHWLPKKFAFFVSSSLPVNLIAYLSIILVYSNIPLDLYTIISGVLLFIVLMLLFKLINVIVPTAEGQEGDIEKPSRYGYDNNGMKEV